MQSSTLHIKVTPEVANALKSLSKKRETSVGELVRQAVHSCYQLDMLNLNEKLRRAVEAFKGGYVSLGKLAEEMGMNVWDTQKWLTEHDIAQNNSFLEDDVSNA
jgi:L-lactate utilization protein LutC